MGAQVKYPEELEEEEEIEDEEVEELTAVPAPRSIISRHAPLSAGPSPSAIGIAPNLFLHYSSLLIRSTFSNFILNKVPNYSSHMGENMR